MALVGPQCNGCGRLPSLAGITIGAPYDSWWCVGCFQAGRHTQPRFLQPVDANKPYAINFQQPRYQNPPIEKWPASSPSYQAPYTTSIGTLSAGQKPAHRSKPGAAHTSTTTSIPALPASTTATSRKQPSDEPGLAQYTIGWICAIEVEYVAACEMLDRDFGAPEGLTGRDDNFYTYGRIGQHNVVMACLPRGKYGITSAATVATNMLRSFPGLRNGIRLMVGVGGGVPSSRHDIRLGDVVVSAPVGRTGGVIHYEFGKTIQNREFERTGSLSSPPAFLLSAINALSVDHSRFGHKINDTVSKMVWRNPRLQKRWQRPDVATDVLYRSDFVHAESKLKCSQICSLQHDNKVVREEREDFEDNPAIHHGLVASADRLMKDARLRDQLSAKEDVLCFEMEAAGLMDGFHCLVIRGICDYADSHKNDAWQGYAAATAAAYAKELLNKVPPANATRTS